MKKYIILFILLTGFSITSASYAASTAGYYNCGQILSMIDEDNPLVKRVMITWYLGFYSGRNWETGYEEDNFPDGDSIYYATVKYCKENPLKDSFDASVDIYNKLTK
jgi:hypothetical protein